jgi:hypothetical protein
MEEIDISPIDLARQEVLLEFMKKLEDRLFLGEPEEPEPRCEEEAQLRLLARTRIGGETREMSLSEALADLQHRTIPLRTESLESTTKKLTYNDRCLLWKTKK